jgi:Tfp pilus assembly protein PilF
MKRMRLKKITGFLFYALIFVFFAAFDCRAEKIYYRDGRVFSGEVLYRKGQSVWVKTKLGSMGIPLENIDKIVNEDGSISKHDYKSLSDSIQASILKKDYSQALSLCAVLLEVFPQDNQLHYLRGILSQKSGDPVSAEAEYRFLIEHKAADAKVFNNLGAIYAKAGKDKQAQELFVEALKSDPEIKEARDNLAAVSMHLKDYPRAIEEYQKALDLDPDSPRILYNLGTAYFNNDDYAGAKAQWEKVLAVDPQDLDSQKALEFLRAKKLSD